MASLLYGAGLWLMECVRLRVKDIDFGYAQITVRDGKGNKVRVTMLPGALREKLEEHLGRVKALHQKDLIPLPFHSYNFVAFLARSSPTYHGMSRRSLVGFAFYF